MMMTMLADQAYRTSGAVAEPLLHACSEQQCPPVLPLRWEAGPALPAGSEAECWPEHALQGQVRPEGPAQRPLPARPRKVVGVLGISYRSPAFHRLAALRIPEEGRAAVLDALQRELGL